MNESFIIKFKNLKVFETPLFREVVKEYFQTIFPKIFESYTLIPAKGGTYFEKYSDMSYPMHILNGILPAMSYLEKKMMKGNISYYEKLLNILKLNILT